MLSISVMDIFMSFQITFKGEARDPLPLEFAKYQASNMYALRYRCDAPKDIARLLQPRTSDQGDMKELNDEITAECVKTPKKKEHVCVQN